MTSVLPKAAARRRSVARDTTKIIQTVSAFIIGLVLISPLLMLAVGSLKPDRFVILSDMGSMRAFWVTNPTLQNFIDLSQSDGANPMLRYLMNSMIVLVATVILGLLFNSMAAFVLARGKLRGRSVFLAAIIGLYIIPQESIVMPLVSIVTKMGLIDTFAVQILPWTASPLYIFLLYQFFVQIPDEIYDAATMDNAGPFSIYWRIFLPMSMPALATVAILQGIEAWNQYLWPIMVTHSSEVRPIAVGIAGYFGADTIYWNLAFTGSVMMMVPVLIFYLLFQRWFVASMVSSAVKG